MKHVRLLSLFTLILFSTGFNSCKKEADSCYDAQLEQQSKNVNCPQDCGGIIGCDGKTYCNECEANRQGIRKK
jgi:hypothetical protein